MFTFTKYMLTNTFTKKVAWIFFAFVMAGLSISSIINNAKQPKALSQARLYTVCNQLRLRKPVLAKTQIPTAAYRPGGRFAREASDPQA